MPLVVGLIGVVAGTLILVNTFVLSDDGSRAQGAPIGVVAASDFDPQGDGSENPDTVAGAIDGDPATGWRTQTYATPDLGGLKDGVGLRLDLDGAHDVSSVTVQADAAGWSAEVYVAENPGDTLESWGEPRAAGSDLGTSARLDLPSGSAGNAVLVWVTRMPPGGRLIVHDVQIG